MSEERRVNTRLKAYWESKRGTRPYPAESDINPEGLKDVWDSAFLIQVVDEGEHVKLRYAYMGSELIETFGDDLTGRDVYDALLSTDSDPIVKELFTVIETKQPLIQDAEFENVQRVVIKFRRGLFPLGPDDQTIDYILGGVRWIAT